MKGSKKFILGLFLAFVIVGGVSFLLRNYALHHLLVDFDEPDYLNFALDYTNEIRDGNYKMIYWYDSNLEHPVLSKLVYAAILYNTPKIDEFIEKDIMWLEPVTTDAQQYIYPTRTASAVFGTLTAACLALVNPLGGLLLALHRTAIHYTSVVYLEALPALMASLSVIAYFLWKKRFNPKHSKPWQKADFWLFFSAVFLGLTAASKYVYCLAGIAILIDAVWPERDNRLPFKSLLARFFMWGGLAVVVFFLSNPILWPHPLDRLLYSLRFHFAYSQSEYVLRVDYPWWQPFKWLVLEEARYLNGYLFNIDWVILIMAGIGLPFTFKKQRVFAIWLVLSLGFLLVWNTKWPQYTMTVLTPLCLSAGVGLQTLLSHLWGTLRRKKPQRYASLQRSK